MWALAFPPEGNCSYSSNIFMLKWIHSTAQYTTTESHVLIVVIAVSPHQSGILQSGTSQFSYWLLARIPPYSS